MAFCDKLCRYCPSKLTCANGSYSGLEKHVTKGCKKMPRVTPSHTCKYDSPWVLSIDHGWMPAVDGMLSTLSQRKVAARANGWVRATTRALVGWLDSRPTPCTTYNKPATMNRLSSGETRPAAGSSLPDGLRWLYHVLVRGSRRWMQ